VDTRDKPGHDADSYGQTPYFSAYTRKRGSRGHTTCDRPWIPAFAAMTSSYPLLETRP